MDSPSAEMVYGVSLGEYIEMGDLVEWGFLSEEDANDFGSNIFEAIECIAAKYDLDAITGYGWEDPEYIIGVKKFSAYDRSELIPDKLPKIDEESIQNLKKITKKINGKLPGWLLVPFYG